MTSVWTVKGGRRGEREDRLLQHGLIGGGWDELPSLAEVKTRTDLASVYRTAYPEASAKTAANYVGQLWSLVSRMQLGELVVLPVKTTGTVAVGRIKGPYEFREDLGDDLRHCRPVTWLATDIPRDQFDQDLLFSFGAFLTFGRVKRDNAETRVLAAIKGETVATLGGAEQGDEETVDVAPDVEAIAREQVRQHVTQTFAGHALTDLVARVLEAVGYSSVTVSPPGADGGVDILAGSGPLGMDLPRVAVQVKTGQAGVDEYRALRGVMAAFGASEGLLVAWSGFRGTVRQEARTSHFSIRLWDADDLLNALFPVYERLPDNVRSRLPLKRVNALVIDAE